MNRRTLLMAGAAAGTVGLGACTTAGQIDPAQVIADVKTSCSILVPAATVLEIVNASVGATVASIVDLICTAFHSTQLAGGASVAPGTGVDFVVVVNGKKIPVHATVAH